MNCSSKIKKSRTESRTAKTGIKKGTLAALPTPLFYLVLNGAEERNRTADTGIFSPFYFVSHKIPLHKNNID